MRRRWTAEEEHLLRSRYVGKQRNHKTLEELATQLNRGFYDVRGMVKSLGLTKRRAVWSPGELEYLQENYGREPAETIAKHLNRSKNALKIIAYRKLKGLNQRSNIYTARNVAELLGIACAKTITETWVKYGYITGKKAPFYYGEYQVWQFEYEDIIACLLRRPWLVDCRKMEPSFFRSIVKEEWARDPWYTTKGAVGFLGLKDRNALHRYIRRGWVKAERVAGAGGLGQFIIRKSAIDAFLQNDPRKPRYHVKIK